jgi:hypothetical protein
MTISREEAHRIAEAHLRKELDTAQLPADPARVSGIREVRSIDEVRAPMPYGLRVPIEECWIAYLEEPTLIIRSSTIILIRKDSGKVVYSGDANDEG